MRKLLFIINPRSGKKNSPHVIEVIKKGMPKELAYEIGLWTNLDEFDVLAKKLLNEGFTDAIAVGGDGSVNLVGKTVLNTNITLGIIPTGSGNGLARSIGMPMDTKKALAVILKNKIALIDHGLVNGIPFFCTSGMGFDAHIGHLFANTKKRGLQTYIKMIFREFFNYKIQNYILQLNSETHTRTALFVTVANAGQFGNNFYIAPEAKLDDGLFHVVVFKPFNLLVGLAVILKIIRGQAHKSKYIETFTCKQLSIKREKEDSIHYDGEPAMKGMELEYTINPKALKVIVGDTFDGI